jgi:hypothetical protein
MPRPKRIQPYFLGIIDEDRGEFNVVGPMTDDTGWNHQVCEAQNEGRKVRVCGTDVSREHLKSEIQKLFELKFSLDPLIHPPAS